MGAQWHTGVKPAAHPAEKSVRTVAPACESVNPIGARRSARRLRTTWEVL